MFKEISYQLVIREEGGWRELKSLDLRGDEFENSFFSVQGALSCLLRLSNHGLIADPSVCAVKETNGKRKIVFVVEDHSEILAVRNVGQIPPHLLPSRLA